MSKDLSIIRLSKEDSVRIYNSVKNIITEQNSFVSLLDNKLIDELFAREVVKYLSKMHIVENNTFKRVDCIMDDNTMKQVSFGMVKATVDSEPKLTYGII